MTDWSLERLGALAAAILREDDPETKALLQARMRKVGSSQKISTKAVNAEVKKLAGYDPQQQVEPDEPRDAVYAMITAVEDLRAKNAAQKIL